ncbi:hypothetical protein [Clostridium perfringens]|uniref:hypothetical protein n=1 Tax=Clostridium perfringens TaxID=1502 RepID=UPI001A1F2A9E|nr:hypothetical protein [Clostridium perfringens]WEV19471.1 hypothetical protein PL323_02300 [Clostridium perfringens D]HAT4354504.1 hypothetical protein [Clostridium perfringens]
MENLAYKKLPSCFMDTNEKYLIVSKLKQFCYEKGIAKNEEGIRAIGKGDFLNSLETYYNKNEETRKEVADFIDSCLKEGIKRVMICELSGYNELKDIKNIEEYLMNIFSLSINNNIILYEHKEEVNLCGFDLIKNGDSIKKIDFKFSVLLKERKTRTSPFNTIVYPIWVTLDVEGGYLIGRAKSKSGLFRRIRIEDGVHRIDKDGNDLSVGDSTDCDKLMLECFNIIVSKILFLKIMCGANTMDSFKRKVHRIVDECTKTPIEISEKINNEESNIEDFVKKFFNKYNISFVERNNFSNATEDIKIFMEKYLSVSEKNENIFTENRYAYPIRIGATDSELSSVDEVSSDQKPLQCTSIFFDNKKILNKEKKCDHVRFIFIREKTKYFTMKKFPVNIEVKRGYLYLEFKQYTLEEDIENVLSRIIRNS